MSKHTPGPWIAGNDEDSDYFLVGPHDGDGLVHRPVVKLHSEADADLIAAAPELLAVCKQIRAHGTLSSTWIDSLDAAIAKAGGAA